MPFKDKNKREKYHKEYNHFWYLKNKTRHTKICPVCLVEFKTRYIKQKCCSKKCSSLNMRQTSVCLGCGKTFYAPKCKKRKYCSRLCSSNNSNIREIALKTQERRKNDKEYGEKWRINLKKGTKLADHSKNIERFKAMVGEKNHMWKGGITPEYKKIRNTPEYKVWRTSVFERDNYTCQKCKSRSYKGNTVILQAHHIIPLCECLIKDKKRILDVDNGITLCLKCHRKTDSYAKNFMAIDYLPR